jgi:VanZ family protein
MAPFSAARSSNDTGISWGWFIAMLAIIALAWGNSLASGQESGELSSGALAMIKSMLTALSIPNDWLTEFIVRKTAHFTEYFALGITTLLAFHPHRIPRSKAKLLARRIVTCVLILVCVPAFDELVIQRLFSVGRSGQTSDVLLDCCGAATGVVLALAVSLIRRHRARKKAAKPSNDAA